MFVPARLVSQVGSFYCTCDSGYQNYQAGVGCTDINECGISEGVRRGVVLGRRG